VSNDATVDYYLTYSDLVSGYSICVDDGTVVAYDYQSPVSTGTEKQYVWDSTSGTGSASGQTSQSDFFTVTQTSTVTGTYETRYVVTIDIKPGSYPNSINPNEEGLLPVAILGSATFNVETINPSTIMIGSVALATRGSAKAPKLAFSYEDVNGDGYVDMMVFFSVQELETAGIFDTDPVLLTLTGQLSDGTPITGTDSVRIVPP